MVFNIHYISDVAIYAKANKIDPKEVEVGRIIAYQEGPDETPEEEIALGVSVYSSPVFINILDDSFNVKVKFDIKNNKLVLL